MSLMETGSVDDWELTSTELESVLAARGEPRHNVNVLSHGVSRPAVRSVEVAVDAMRPCGDYAVFCDGLHYRVLFRIQDEWHLFDSLGMYSAFEDQVWPLILAKNTSFTLRRLTLRPQTDGVNCGVWALWVVSVWRLYIQQPPPSSPSTLS